MFVYLILLTWINWSLYLYWERKVKKKYHILLTWINWYRPLYSEKQQENSTFIEVFFFFFFAISSWRAFITKTYLYNFDPHKPHFYMYIVKLGFTGVYIIFLISAQKHRLWYSLEPPHRGGSNEYLQSMFWAEIRKNIRIFHLKIFIFW